MGEESGRRARSLRSRYKREPEEWRGRKFMAISLAVTALSIIFFFALRLLSPTIKESAAGLRAYAIPLMQRIIDWGGMKVQSIKIDVVSEEGAKGSDSEKTGGEKSFSQEKMLGNLRDKMSSYYGQPFWLLDLEALQAQALETGWAKEVFIRRAFPGTLKIQILPRHPFFVAKAQKSWVVLDASGMAIFTTQELPGWLADRPILFGLSNLLATELSISAINRKLDSGREAIVELAEITAEIEKRFSVNIDTAQIFFDAQLDRSQFELIWKDRSNRDFKVRLSSSDWKYRIENLQFVLSDAISKGARHFEINGEYDGRWIVSQGGEAR